MAKRTNRGVSMSIFELLSKLFFPKAWRSKIERQLQLEEQQREADQASLRKLEEKLTEEQRIEQENYSLRQEVFISKTKTLLNEILDLNILFAESISKPNKTSILLDSKSSSTNDILKSDIFEVSDIPLNQEQIISELYLLEDMHDIYINLAIDVLFGELEIVEAVRIILRRTWLVQTSVFDQKENRELVFNNGNQIDFFHLVKEVYPSFDKMLNKRYYVTELNEAGYSQLIKGGKSNSYRFKLNREKGASKEVEELDVYINGDKLRISTEYDKLCSIDINLGDDLASKSINQANLAFLESIIDNLIELDQIRIDLFFSSKGLARPEEFVEALFEKITIKDYFMMYAEYQKAFHFLNQSANLSDRFFFSKISQKMEEIEDYLGNIVLAALKKNLLSTSEHIETEEIYRLLKVRANLCSDIFFNKREETENVTFYKNINNKVNLYEYHEIADTNDKKVNELAKSIKMSRRTREQFYSISDYWKVNESVSESVSESGEPSAISKIDMKIKTLNEIIDQEAVLVDFSKICRYLAVFEKAKYSPVYPQNCMITRLEEIEKSIQENIVDLTGQIVKIQTYINYLSRSNLLIEREEVVDQFESAIESIDEYFSELIIETEQAITATADILAEDFDNKNFNFDRIVAFNRSERRRKQREKEDSEFFEELIK